MGIPPNIKARLDQLKAEAAVRAESDRRRQMAIRNAEQAAGKPVGLNPIQKPSGNLMNQLANMMERKTMAKGGVAHLAIGGQGPRNFLKGSVEKVLKPLLPNGPTHRDEALMLGGNWTRLADTAQGQKAISRNEAISNWIQSNLANYIRKQMGHPNDPIRKLAEQGVLHVDPELLADQGKWGEDRRKMLGGEKLGKSEHAQAWEDASDSTFEPNSIEDILRAKDIYKGMQEPWMEKADPKTDVYELYGADNLGFDHIVDILKQDIDSGRIRPEQLSKVSIEHAVRRTHEYDQERKKAMQEASLKATEGMPVHKDYGNGYKWVELTLPEKGEHLLSELDRRIIAQRQDSNPVSQDLMDKTLDQRANEKLAEALKYEGDTMGHCVGGYCPDVAAGRTRIFSLRDAKNEPHVTIEVQPQNEKGYYNSLPSEERIALLEKAIEHKRKSDPTWDERADPKERAKMLREYLNAQGIEPPSRIVQIKGKQNAKPKKQYIPFVQDFVKSGKWSDVGDINNAELRQIGQKYLTDQELDSLSKQHFGKVINNPARYYSDMKRRNPDEISDADKNFLQAIDQHDGGMQKLAKGGKVTKEPKSTVKAYKLFRADEKQPGKLFPLFVNANKPVEMHKWVDAEVGEQNDKGKVKSKIGPLAYRPGWHAGDLPVATHIGEKTDNSLKKPDYRPRHHVWAEVEMPNDVDWQAEANKRGTNKKGRVVPVNAHITDQIPKGGHYRYKTNPNMTGNWLIGGSMKVNRVLSHNEVERINKKAGVSDLPRIEPFNKKDFGFKQGGALRVLDKE